MRRRLKVLKNIEHGVPVVYSTEKPGPVKLLPLDVDTLSNLSAQGSTADDLAVLPDFRSRILPVIGTLPAMFGCAMAGYVVMRLAEWDGFEPTPFQGRDKTYERLYRDLRARDANVYGERYFGT